MSPVESDESYMPHAHRSLYLPSHESLWMQLDSMTEYLHMQIGLEGVNQLGVRCQVAALGLEQVCLL